MFCSRPIQRLLGTLALLTALAPVAGAAAQTIHTCATPDGRRYKTDLPCPAPSGMGQLGGNTTPAPAPPLPPRVAPRPPPLSADQNELAANCAALGEAMRIGLAQGLGHDHVTLLRQEWQRRCGDSGANAQDTPGDVRNAESERRLAEKNAALQSAAERQEQADRCALMRKNLATRRQRPNPTAGEQADLQRFEATYRERCPG